MNGGGIRQPDPMTWYNDIPVVSRVYLTLSFITTAACALDLVSPFSLYFNYKLIFLQGQVWRLFTNFFFFGLFGLDFVFHMYFLVNYCRLLEEGEFRGRTADFIYMLAFGGIAMTAAAPFVNVHFLGSALTFMMVYVWALRNQHMHMGFLGLITFRAPYLPWVLFSLSVLLGADPTIDLIGIACGHTYFWLKFVFPQIAEIRHWPIQRPLKTPWLLRQILGGGQQAVLFADDFAENEEMDQFGADGEDEGFDFTEEEATTSNEPNETTAAEVADAGADADAEARHQTPDAEVVGAE